MQSHTPSELELGHSSSQAPSTEQNERELLSKKAEAVHEHHAMSPQDKAGSGVSQKSNDATINQDPSLSGSNLGTTGSDHDPCAGVALSHSYSASLADSSGTAGASAVSSASSFRPKTIVAVENPQLSSSLHDEKPDETNAADGVLAQTEKLLSKGFSSSHSKADSRANDHLPKDKPQLDDLDREQWIAQTSAYNQKILNRFEVKPLCDPVGKPLSNPHGTPASKPFLDLPTDFLNTTIECRDGFCEVVEGEEVSVSLEDMTTATAPRSEVLTEPLLPEDIYSGEAGVAGSATVGSNTEPLPPLTEALPPLTEPLPPLTEALPPLTEALPPLTEPLPPLTEPLPPLTEALPPLTEPLVDPLEPMLDNTAFLDQNHLSLSGDDIPNQVQAAHLNLEPLSQKSASQALHQGANSPHHSQTVSAPQDFMQNLPSGEGFKDPILESMLSSSNGLTQPLGLSPALPQETSPAQMTAMALQAANAQKAMAQQAGHELPSGNLAASTAGAASAAGVAGTANSGTLSDAGAAQHDASTSGEMDPMFCFQQSMAQGYNQDPAVGPAGDNTAKTSDNMALHSVHSFNKISRMPGLVLYKLKNNTVFYDCYAAEFLGIGNQAGSCSLRQFLHLIGRSVVHDLISRLKPLKDELHISADNVCTSMNVVNLSCMLPHGLCKGATVYVRVAAFFDEKGMVRYFTFTFMRQMPNNMAFIPDLLTNNTSFAWLVQEDKLSLSQHYYKLLGYPEQNEPLILSFSTWENTLVHPHDRVAIKRIQPIIESPNHGNSFEICYRSRKVNGTYIWTKSIGTVVARDAKGKATRIIGVNCDINEMVDGYDRLRSKVYTDVLTGLKNRTYLVQHVRDFIQPQMQPLSILFFDATALKLYNDYLGHAMGDKLLFSIANILNENIAFENELIRISGDEMLCVLPMCDELMLQMVMDDVSAALEAYNANAPVRMPVFFSMGNITINLNTQLYNRMRMQYAKQLRSHENETHDHTRLFNQHVALNRTLAWQNWAPDDKQLDMAYELFFQAVQQADKNMQEAKQANREEHYSLIRAYIEQTLHKRIDLNDKRLLNIDHGMLA